MRVGDLVLAPFNHLEVEPRLYQIRSIAKGRAGLTRVGITDGVMGRETAKIDVYRLRSYRYLHPDQVDVLRRAVLDLRRKRAEVRDLVNALPLLADVP